MTAANQLFDRLCIEREQAGEEKYGTLTWVTNDTLGMAMEEVIDLANYLRYTFIKIYFMAEKLKQISPDFGSAGHNIPLGPTAFDPIVPPKED